MAKENGSGASLRAYPGLLTIPKKHTEIIYILTHLGSSFLGICPWITPFQRPRNTSQLLLCILKTEINVIWMSWLFVRYTSVLIQDGQSLGIQGGIRQQKHLEKHKWITWIFSFAIIYECNRFLYNEVSYSDGDRYSFPCLSFISYTWTWWLRNIMQYQTVYELCV